MRRLILGFVVFTLMAFVSAEGVAAQDAVATPQRSAPAAQYMLALGATAGTAPATIIPSAPSSSGRFAAIVER